MDQIISSAALYFEPQPTGSIPEAWLETAVQIVTAPGFPVRHFGMLPNNGEDRGYFAFSEHEAMLLRNLRQRKITSLEIYAYPGEDLVDMAAYGSALLSLTAGYCFLGLPQAGEPSLRTLLQRIFVLCKTLVAQSYGIAYYHRSFKGPSWYALGMSYNDYEFDAVSVAARDRLSKWLDERSSGGQRRYLKGWFRAAYPANILTDAHLDVPLGQGIPLRNAKIGRLTQLDQYHWLWELTDREIPIAENALREAGRMICG